MTRIMILTGTEDPGLASSARTSSEARGPRSCVEIQSRLPGPQIAAVSGQVVFIAIGEPIRDVPGGGGPLARCDRHRREVGVGAADVVVQAAIGRATQALLQLGVAIACVSHEHLGGADVRQRVDDGLGHVEPLGELERVDPSSIAGSRVMGQHPQL